MSLGSRTNTKVFKIHRAVACTFLDNPNMLPMPNHKDGIKTNNTYTNLEWCTYSYNTQHAYNSGLCTVNGGNLQKRIRNIDTCIVYKSITEAARVLYGDNWLNARKVISRVCNNRRKTAYGYRWEFV